MDYELIVNIEALDALPLSELNLLSEQIEQELKYHEERRIECGENVDRVGEIHHMKMVEKIDIANHLIMDRQMDFWRRFFTIKLPDGSDVV
ncbi:hypothetical protein [Spirosoma sp. 48-14]|uniref:hypothetical protein n=1 Tax=Spirosoma sp. 48-14 TaxID=1895854 RepID=UPI00095A4D14|nr:hypothetical protein [Spirosoma sp. 48-14]OJW78455.1 MAG: hypothetical protein BGO59_31115 [Spirosoma sp. 48-14]